MRKQEKAWCHPKKIEKILQATVQWNKMYLSQLGMRKNNNFNICLQLTNQL